MFADLYEIFQISESSCRKRKIALWFIFCLCCFSISIAGCSTISQPAGESNTQRTMKAYLTQIDKTDGIDQEEALLLAKSQFIFRDQDTRYDLNKPSISSEQDAWVLTFPPIHKTLGELLSPTDLIIRVDKEDGRIEWIEQQLSFLVFVPRVFQPNLQEKTADLLETNQDIGKKQFLKDLSSSKPPYASINVKELKTIFPE